MNTPSVAVRSHAAAAAENYETPASTEWLVRTAWHEAGHAVVGYFQGGRLVHALVRPDGSGEVLFRDRLPTACDRLAVLLAGYAAEATFCRRVLFDPERDAGRAGSDSEGLASLRRQHGEHAFNLAMGRAFTILDEHAEAVQDIADELYRNIFPPRVVPAARLISLIGG